MKHESFYALGIYPVPEMGIYAGWVAHENSFGAAQPFCNERRDVVLLFSGECFVDPEARASVGQKGCRLGQATGSWLVHCYEKEGSQFFEKLNGLFSGLLIDKRRGKTFLFNDRYGVERIYCHETSDATYFASEAKALLRILPELRAFDQEGIAQFLTFGCTLGQRTLFRGVELLPEASVWSFENGKCQKKKYFSSETWESQTMLPADSFQAEFQKTFERVLPRYFESQSRVGISLTAGLDSRMIMACLSKHGEKPICYTFAGEKQDTLDARLARQVAKACGLEHEILRLSGDFFSNFGSYADRTVYITDGCLGALGAHEIYLNRQARQLASVRLTGVFGGEILRGVSMFKPLPLSPRLVNPELGQSLNCLAQEWNRNSQHPVSFTAFREIPQKRFGTPAASRSQLTFRTPYLDNEIVALAYRAPESLRGSPLPAWSVVRNNNHSLSRIPTDMGIVAKASTLGMAPRRIFSKAVCKLDYLYAEGLPHWLSSFDRLFDLIDSRARLFGRHKFLHYRKWFRRELADYIAGTLKEVQTRRSSPFWNFGFLETLAHEHINGRRNFVHEIDAVLTLDAVDRLLFHGLPRDTEQRAPAISRTAPAPI
ncbi:MAG TPA: asparagine synthase-related protein [Nitrososphaera sp.]|nr:asparagine synthase-related protein [Nitrososphaera sp.]